MAPLPLLLRRLGRVVRRLRSQAGYSQDRFAAAIGVHRTYMGQLERGLANPTTKILYFITERLGLTLPELFTMALSEDSPETAPPDIPSPHRKLPSSSAAARPRIKLARARRSPGKGGK